MLGGLFHVWCLDLGDIYLRLVLGEDTKVLDVTSRDLKLRNADVEVQPVHYSEPGESDAHGDNIVLCKLGKEQVSLSLLL